MSERRRKVTTEIGALFKSIDIFGSSIGFTFDGGHSRYRTYYGACATLVLYTVLLFYSSISLQNFIQTTDAAMSSYTTHNFFNYTHEFTSDMGLQIAFGFGEFKSGEKKTYEEIKDYGTL